MTKLRVEWGNEVLGPSQEFCTCIDVFNSGIMEEPWSVLEYQPTVKEPKNFLTLGSTQSVIQTQALRGHVTCKPVLETAQPLKPPVT